MKTRKNIYFKIVASAAIVIVFATSAKAQLPDNGYVNIDWQFNAPLSNHSTDKAGGWGMNFKGGYFVTPNIGLGLFLNYHSNHKYVGRKIFQIDAGEATTDQQHTIFRLPFGVAARYQWNHGGFLQPYVSAKLGVEHAKVRFNFNMLEVRENSWGFYAFPEVGINVFPWVYGPGLYFVLYYSYGINKVDVLCYSVDGLSNSGFRLGVSL